MLGLGPIDYAVVALGSLRFLGLKRTLLAALALGAASWMLVPRPCGCIRLPFERCAYTPRYVWPVRSSASNLMSLEEIYYADHFSYTDDPNDLGFVADPGVTVLVTLSGEGWRAWVTHDQAGAWEGCMVEGGLRQGSEGPSLPRGMECRFEGR